MSVELITTTGERMGFEDDELDAGTFILIEQIHTAWGDVPIRTDRRRFEVLHVLDRIAVLRELAPDEVIVIDVRDDEP